MRTVGIKLQSKSRTPFQKKQFQDNPYNPWPSEK